MLNSTGKNSPDAAMPPSSRSTDENRPTLSIVVGSNNARASIRDCLSQLERQCTEMDAELIVVDNSTDGTLELAREHFPDVTYFSASDTSYIPELWAVGIRASRGPIIAITTAHCVPADDWLLRILEAHDTPHPGIGGAIENKPGAGLTNWAIYFCRYSSFMLPFPDETVDEIAGDNASYKRSAIERHSDTWEAGFWEPDVHAALREEGHTLRRTPSIVVRHVRSFDFTGFLQNRFWHGRQHGQSRARLVSFPRRLLLIARSPLVPFVLLARVARNVLSRRRHVGVFLASLPLLLVFYLSWTTGEVAGYFSTPQTSSL